MNDSPRKKILYIITKSNGGGAQRYVYDLTVHFAKSHDITVAFGGNDELAEKLKAIGVKTISIPYLEREINIKNDLKVFFWLLRFFKSLEPDIIHLNSSKVGAIGAIGARLFNLPSLIFHKISPQRFTFKKTRVIFTAHGWAFNEDRGLIFKDVSKIAHWFTILLSDKTICVSHKTAHQITDLPFLQKKISIVHNGISKITFAKKGEAQNTLMEKNERMRQFVESPDPKKRKALTWIGTISELHKNKGLEYCIQALSIFKLEHPLFIFVIIGEGEEEARLAKLIEEKGLKEQVFLLGKVEGAAKLLKALHIFTLTSTTEAFPYTLLEAGLAELPVVASNVGGIPEAVDQLQSGILVRPKEEREIREAIDFLLHHKDKKKLFAANLKTKIKEQFSVEKMLEETEKVYEQDVRS